MYPSIEDLVSETPLDFDRLRNELVIGSPYVPSFGKHAALDDQVAMLTQEFAGQSRLKLTHALLNMLLRRKIAPDAVYAQFNLLWESHRDLLLEILDARWLVSACDTICDHSPDPAEAQSAALISLFANTVKLAESERLMSPPTATDLRPAKGRVPLFDGMTAFTPGAGDMPANLIGRLNRALQPETVIGAIGREVITRCLANDTVFARFSEQQVKNTWPPYLAPVLITPSSRSGNVQVAAKQDEAGRPGYILLNDTGRLGSSFHIGTLFACSTIRHNLSRRGLHEVGWANDRARFEALISSAEHAPALVVVNGEGTMHHGAERAQELLSICLRAKELGCAVALVNSVWEANPRKMAAPLRALNLIHVRDSKSRAALPRDIAATVTPDASIQMFLEATKDGTFLPSDHDFAVIDSDVPKATNALLGFAEHYRAPFFTMPGNSLYKTRAEVAKRSGPVRPHLLQVPDLMGAQAWVTGRFHGIVAALCAGKPVCALSSNTAKVEAFFRDAGLQDECLLGWRWRRASPERKRDEVMRRIDMQQDEAFIRKRTAYLEDASARIDRMFDEVAALV